MQFGDGDAFSHEVCELGIVREQLRLEPLHCDALPAQHALVDARKCAVAQMFDLCDMYMWRQSGVDMVSNCYGHNNVPACDDQWS